MEPEYDQSSEADNNLDKKYQSVCETSMGKVLIMNNSILAGVKSFAISYDIDNPVATVTVIMAIKRNSLSISHDEIKFETTGYKPSGH